jgi:hypothetical protein
MPKRKQPKNSKKKKKSKIKNPKKWWKELPQQSENDGEENDIYNRSRRLPGNFYRG